MGIETTNSLEEIHSRAFRSARKALDRALYRENPSAEPSATESLSDIDRGSCSLSSPTLLPMISPEADSAHVTGFHHAGGMSRYNVRREGIVFSDDRCSCDQHICDGDDEVRNLGKRQHQLCGDEDKNSMLSDFSGMFWSLHGIADRVLLSIEKKLELSDDFSTSCTSDLPTSKRPGSQRIDSEQRAVGWFQRQLGPTETSSQWHLKRFVIGGEDEDEDEANRNSNDGNDTVANGPAIQRTEHGERITLPMHTDPSLLSVVIHDGHGESSHDEPVVGAVKDSREAPGALGLQYFHPEEKRWEEPELHGHSVATIFVGSVLAHLTCGTYPAAKHRVVETASTQASAPPKRRMAATLFVRPQPSSLLLVPLPSPWLRQRIEEAESEKDGNRQNTHGSDGAENRGLPDPPPKQKKKKSLAKPPITFDAWLKRVARNYEKQKKKQGKKSPKNV